MPWVLPFLFLGIHFDPSVLTIPIVEAAPLSISDLKAMATEIAKEHKLNVDHFLATIQMESGFDPDSLGDYVNGIPTSIGIAQLHYPSKDWGISTSTAHDPTVSLEKMATAWQNDQAYRWSAWCSLYGTVATKCPLQLIQK